MCPHGTAKHPMWREAEPCPLKQIFSKFPSSLLTHHRHAPASPLLLSGGSKEVASSTSRAPWTRRLQGHTGAQGQQGWTEDGALNRVIQMRGLAFFLPMLGNPKLRVSHSSHFQVSSPLGIDQVAHPYGMDDRSETSPPGIP